MQKKKPKKARNKEKNMKKMKKRNRTKGNLILSHVNLTFLPIGPMPLHTLIVAYKKMFF